MSTDIIKVVRVAYRQEDGGITGSTTFYKNGVEIAHHFDPDSYWSFEFLARHEDIATPEDLLFLERLLNSNRGYMKLIK